MTFSIVFVERKIEEHPVTKAVLDRLARQPSAPSIAIVDGRRFHKDIAEAASKLRVPRESASYEDALVDGLRHRFDEQAIRFVGRTGAKAVGVLTRGEVCALSKPYLFLTDASSDDVLLMVSRRARNFRGR